jgi:hypothetical protein
VSEQQADEARSLKDVLDRVADADGAEAVSVENIVASVGRRSFGPLLLVPGLLLISPLSGIPGFGTAMAAIVFLVALQLVVGRHKVWMPRFLLQRSLKRDKIDGAMSYLKPAARVIDKLVHPRLSFLAEGIFGRLIGVFCLFIAFVMPPLEFVPFANTTSGAAISLFGLSLVARDGVLATLALAATGGIIYFGYSTLF